MTLDDRVLSDDEKQIDYLCDRAWVLERKLCHAKKGQFILPILDEYHAIITLLELNGIGAREWYYDMNNQLGGLTTGDVKIPDIPDTHGHMGYHE